MKGWKKFFYITEARCQKSEVGKVTLKINGNEALSDESVLKSNCDKALNNNFS